jgi:O-antigen/teichoic acid export membrane protein
VVGEDTKLAPVTDVRDRADIDGLARRGVLSLGGAAVSALASFLVVVVITRGANKIDAGKLFSATSLFVIAESLCALGTATGLVYFIARTRALGRGDQVRRALRIALPPVIGVSVIVASVACILAPTIATVISNGSDHTLIIYIRVLAMFLPFAVLFDVLIAGTQGFHTMTPTVILDRIGRPTLQLVLVGGALALGSVWLLPVAWAAPYAVGVMTVAAAVARLLRTEPQAMPQHPADGAGVISAGRFWRYTGPRGIAAVAQLTLQRLDIVLVASFLGPRDAAIYTAATRFVVLGQLGSQSVSLAVQPKLSELLATKELAGTRRVYQTSTAWVMAVTWPVHLLIAVLAPVILLLFGAGYDEGRWVAVVLAGAMLLATGCGMVTMVLVMAGRTTANLVNVAIALVSNVALNLVLIPRIGIIGAGIAWAVSIILSNLIPLVEVRVSLGLHPFGPGSAAIASLSVATLGILPASGWLFGGHPTAVVILAGIGLVAYTVGVWKLRRLLQLEALIKPIVARF